MVEENLQYYFSFNAAFKYCPNNALQILELARPLPSTKVLLFKRFQLITTSIISSKCIDIRRTCSCYMITPLSKINLRTPPFIIASSPDAIETNTWLDAFAQA